MIACWVALPETYGPRLLELKARRLRKETGNTELRPRDASDKTPSQLFYLSVMRAIRLLWRSPIVPIVSLLLAVAYSYMYLMFTTFTDVFEATYGFNAGQTGLCYLGLGVGSLIGQYALDILMKQYRARQMARHGIAEPEDQLPPLLPGSLLIAVGLICYGWSLEYRIHWMVPIIGTAICGIGISCFFLAVQTFLVEAFPQYAASALAANTVVRCIFGLTIPLAAPSLYATLGLGWGNTLLAFFALAVIPPSLWLLKYGKDVRTNPKYVLQL